MHDNDVIARRFNADNYHLLEKIGQGGFGEVYKARQCNTEQLVAIKFLTLDASFTDEKKRRYIDRFEREALLCSRLQHPNIVRLLDKGLCDDELLYAVFEYVDGMSLKQVLATSGPFPPVEAAQLMAQVLDALAHAHEQGVIHRDIKPANIMLTRVGAKTHAKVLDFGIGTLVNEARQLDYKSLTLTQETLGTPSYSAPEQLRGEPPTPKTDLYVWGLVFIECLTGRPAIYGASLASIFHQQLSQSNVPLPAAVVGHPVGGLLRRALNKKIDERIDKASELYNQLQQMNLSTLVGELNIHAGYHGQAAPDDNTELMLSMEQTQIEEYGSFTRLTEVKQITVLCVSLDIKAIEEDIDHEIIDTLLWDQLLQCQDIAIRYGAFHVGTLGDTLLFYFGYPVVSDNDSRLAARTALEISSELSKRNLLLRQTQGVETQVRMGLHTGMVTAFSDAIPQGETPNMAMKLASRASANQALCTNETRLRLDTHIEFMSAGTTIIGVSEQKQSLYTLNCERQSEAFGFLRANRRKNVFVGRQTQMSGLLTRVNATAETSAKRAVHLYGEAGIGKSRLVYEFRDKVSHFTHIVAQCLPEYKNSALYPILNVLRYLYSLDTLTPEEAISRLKGITNEYNQPELTDALPVLFDWLGLPLPDDMLPSFQPPDRQKQLLFDVVIALLCRRQSDSGNRPNLLIFEDMHWSDPTSLEFIDRLLDSNGFSQAQHAFVSTSRQPLPDAFGGHDYLSFELLKLGKEETIEFICELFDHQMLADNLLQVVVERTDGIPLFIEELVNMLNQQKLVEHINGRYDFVSPDKQAQLPNSLRDSLQQKLDLLVCAKETAQLAATIGRQFAYDLLVKASNFGESQVQTDLNELLAAELVYKQRKVGGDSYIFKHALVRDAAYEGMPAQQQRLNHRQIAHTLVNNFNNFSKDQPLVVAQHYAGGHEFAQATELGIEAVRKAVGNSANEEAISVSKIVATWLPHIPDLDTSLEAELVLNEVTLPAELSLSGFGADPVRKIGLSIKSIREQMTTLTAATTATLSARDKQQLQQQKDELDFKVDWILFLEAHYQPRRAEALQRGEALLARCQTQNNRQQIMTVSTHLAQGYTHVGELEKAKVLFERASELYDERLDRNLAREYGTDGKAQNLCLSARLDLSMGQIDSAYAKLTEALLHAEEIGHQASILFTYFITALVASFVKDYDKVIALTEQYEEKHGDKKSYHTCYLYLYYHCAVGDAESAKHELDEQIVTGQLFDISAYISHLADLYLRQSQVDEAAELMEEGLARAVENNDQGAYPFLKKALAECYYKIDKHLSKRVIELMQSAISDANEQHAWYFELENKVYLWSLSQHKNNKAANINIQRDDILSVLNKVSIDSSSPLYEEAIKMLDTKDNQTRI